MLDNYRPDAIVGPTAPLWGRAESFRAVSASS